MSTLSSSLPSSTMSLSSSSLSTSFYSLSLFDIWLKLQAYDSTQECDSIAYDSNLVYLTPFLVLVLQRAT
jgi:hypothetical protein